MALAVGRSRTLAFSLIALAGLSGPARANCLSAAVGPGEFPGPGAAIVMADRQTILTTLRADPDVKLRTIGVDSCEAADINITVTVVEMSDAAIRPELPGVLAFLAFVDPHPDPTSPMIGILSGWASGTDRNGVLTTVGESLLNGASMLEPW